MQNIHNGNNARLLAQQPLVDINADLFKGAKLDDAGDNKNTVSSPGSEFNFSDKGDVKKEMNANERQLDTPLEGEATLEDMFKDILKMLMQLLSKMQQGDKAPGDSPSGPTGSAGAPKSVDVSGGGKADTSAPGSTLGSMADKGARQGTMTESQPIPGLRVFDGPNNDSKAAQQLLATIEQDYSRDPDYKAKVDGLIKEHGSVNATVADTNANSNVVGWGTVGGNDIIIDESHVTNNDTIAHELTHNDGHNHGAGMTNQIKEMLS